MEKVIELLLPAIIPFNLIKASYKCFNNLFHL